MNTGTLHRHAVETNVLMALLGSAWEAGLKRIRDIDRRWPPPASEYRDIDLLGLSGKLVAVSKNLSEKISALEALTSDAEATHVEREFTLALLDYCGSFKQSVDVLNTIYVGLQLRIEEATVGDYSTAAYEHNLATFHDTSRRHKAAGARVNDLYSDLGTNDFEREAFERNQR